MVPADDRDLPVQAPPSDTGEPPVVARLVVEIRSDGSRTIARGALEDRTSGEQVALRVEGSSPAALAGALARSLLRLPALARGRTTLRRAASRLLPGRRR